MTSGGKPPLVRPAGASPSDVMGFAHDAPETPPTAANDDRAAREALIREIARQAASRRAADAVQRRGKECPIQRPMRDRW